MPIHKPTPEQVYQFVAESHMVEKLPCTINDVQATVSSNNPKSKNWYADGHLRAVSTAIKLVQSTDFPTHNPIITTKFQSHEALHWLRNLHLIMLEPVARHPVDVLSNATQINQQECPKIEYLGIYRPQPAGNLFAPAPPAQLIPNILHTWLLQLKAIHDKIKDNLDNPYGIDKLTYNKMKAFTDEQPIFFSSVQPFKDANNRFGRLIENTIRLAWRMPFKYNVANDYDNFKNKLEEYQTINIPQIVKAARDVK
jgi:hypothetical protein